MLILALNIRHSPACKNSWAGFSREAFGGLLSFLRLAVPSAVMVWYNFICSFGECSFYCLIFLRVLPAECSYGTSTSFRIMVVIYVLHIVGCCSLEYWSFEMVVLLSGLLPNPKLEMSVLSIR